MSLKVNDSITNRVAKEMGLDEWVVDRIVSFQFESAKIATRSNNTVEITGLGKFLIRATTLKNRLKVLQTIIASHTTSLQLSAEGTKEYKCLEKKVKSATRDKEFIEEKINKLNESKGNIFRMEKPGLPTEGA